MRECVSGDGDGDRRWRGERVVRAYVNGHVEV